MYTYIIGSGISMMMRLHDNLHSISTERTISGKVKELMTNMSQIADEECSMGIPQIPASDM